MTYRFRERQVLTIRGTREMKLKTGFVFLTGYAESIELPGEVKETPRIGSRSNLSN